MSRPKSTMTADSSGSFLQNISSKSSQHMGELPLPHPVYHSIGPKHRAELRVWLKANQNTIGVFLLLFLLLLVLGGIWRSREQIAEWYIEWNRERNRRRWFIQERRRRRTVIVVGIMRNTTKRASDSEGYGQGDRNWTTDSKGLKKVRFLDEGSQTVVIVNDDDRGGLLVDFLEEEEGFRELF